MMKLTQKQINGLLRHSLVFIGGCLVTMGYISSETLETALGLILTLSGAIMNDLKKKRPSNSKDSEGLSNNND